LKFILIILLRLPPRVRRSLKNRFPGIAFAVLTKSSNLQAWLRRQHKLSLHYDSEAIKMGISECSGIVKSLNQITVVSPFHPIRSGIANYSSELIIELNSLLRVRSVNSFLLNEKFQHLPGTWATIQSLKNSEIRNEILYMLGNGEHHWQTWKWILEFPGYVLIHDSKIPDIPLMLGEASSWYDMDYDEKSTSYLGRMPLHTKGIFVHSAHAAEMVKSQLSKLQQDRIPIHVLSTGHPVPVVRNLVKKQMSRPIFGTFGFQTMQKNPQLTYSCISYLASKTKGRGLICGQTDSYHSDLAKKIWASYGNDVADLEILHWVDQEEYLTRIQEVAVGVQLRSSTNGESSGPLTQLLAFGNPVIVTDIGSFSEYRNLSAIHKIPLRAGRADLPILLQPILDQLSNSEDFEAASQESIHFHKNRTYNFCAREIHEKIFE